jgi:hypothetical protein
MALGYTLGTYGSGTGAHGDRIAFKGPVERSMARSSSSTKHEARCQGRGNFNGRKGGEMLRARVAPKRN